MLWSALSAVVKELLLTVRHCVEPSYAVSRLVLLESLPGIYHYFTSKEPEASRGEVTGPSSHGNVAVSRLGLSPEHGS